MYSLSLSRYFFKINFVEWYEVEWQHNLIRHYLISPQMKPHMEKTNCLIRCHGEHCSTSQCCSRENFLEDTCELKDEHTISKKYDKKEIIPTTCVINLEKFTVYKEEETPEETSSDKSAREVSGCDPTSENTCCTNDEQASADVDSSCD